jgi:lipopolysaccharide transport system ATP-binding protein
MNDDVILRVENLSKQYRLGTLGTGTISHDLNRFFAKIRGKEDPYLKIGESNDRTSKGNSEYVWALKNINFKVKKGEVLGIIGKNGAGKSTLLKILSKVTGPTTGTIKSKGRIASLLEVGTGFHPEMTGKENIFLNGAILGMTKKEIQFKLDEIVSFSGCDRYIDTPVKRYSSGMKVRLAFAVAAYLEPDILVVDEVLAVGDAEFQKKAIGKMQDISNQEGRTILFVSHDMGAIKNLCPKSILLKNGTVELKGPTEEVLKYYLDNQTKKTSQNKKGIFKFNDLEELVSISLFNNSDSTDTIITGSTFKITFGINAKQNFFSAEVGVGIVDVYGNDIMRFNNLHLGNPITIEKGMNTINLVMEDFPIYKSGKYFLNVYLGDKLHYSTYEKLISFEVSNTDVFESGITLEDSFNIFVHKKIKYSYSN